MKNYLKYCVFGLVLVLFAHCSKDNDKEVAAAKEALPGTWVAVYKTVTGCDSLFADTLICTAMDCRELTFLPDSIGAFSLTIIENGSQVSARDMDHLGSGRYQVQDGKLLLCEEDEDENLICETLGMSLSEAELTLSNIDTESGCRTEFRYIKESED